MILGSFKALGVDISGERISFVLLKRVRKGIELANSAEIPVPAGAIKDGNIVNAEAIAKVIKQQKRKMGGRTAKTVMSLFGRPVLLQLVEIPKGLPTNMRQFVADEIKQCVVLPGTKPVFDYCCIDAGRKARDSRLFVSATDGVGIAKIAHSYNQAILNVEVIEPAILSCARALYSNRIAGKFDANVLIAMLRNGVLTLCVFKNQVIDFIRTKTVESHPDGSSLCQWVGSEINEIIQFYDIDVPDSLGKWEITVVSEDVELPADSQEMLKGLVSCVDLEVRTRKNALHKTLVIGGDKFGDTSLIAAGLAMRLLDVEDHNLKNNLFPAEASEVRVLRHDFLVTANIMAAAVLVMILAAGGLAFLVKKGYAEIISKGRDPQMQATYKMLGEQDAISWRIKQMANRPVGLTKLFSLQQDIDWAHFLNDVRACTPKTVRITDLYGSTRSKVVLEGLALSYESIHLFVSMLNKSEYVAEASLAGTEKKGDMGGFIRYAINCVLIQNVQKDK